jgi:hypothetical protein
VAIKEGPGQDNGIPDLDRVLRIAGIWHEPPVFGAVYVGCAAVSMRGLLFGYVPGGEGLFVKPVGAASGGLHVWRPSLFDRLLDERAYGTTEEKVVEYFVFSGHQRYSVTAA